MSVEIVVSARDQLDRIKGHWQAFWFELKDFHDNRRWLELGYGSFKSCVEVELGMSERHVYRLIEAAEIREELGADPRVSTPALTERQARELKPLLPTERIEVARSVDFASVTTRELREVIRDRQRPAEPLDANGRNPATAARWAPLEAWHVPYDFVPVPPAPLDYGFDAWFTAIITEGLARFDPTWVENVPTLPVEVGGDSLDAAWWVDNGSYLRSMVVLLDRLIGEKVQE